MNAILSKTTALILCFLLTIFFTSCGDRKATKEETISPVQTPEGELSSFVLAPGLKIQLVASEPMVQDPVVITFDADGRLWVVEMRGYMPDINGKGEKDRVGRISVLEDSNGDGLMDKSTIYLDSLVLPRALALVPGGALVTENNSLWLTQDTNGDLHADSKTLIDSTYGGGPSPEHSGNGLLRNIDNWYYNARSRSRYKYQEGKWIRDSTEFRGQWGVSHDDEGRLYFNYNWSQLHADLVPPNYLSRNKNHTPTTGIDHGLTIDRKVYPIRANPAVNRGYIPGTLDSSGRLLEFTAACSPLFYRGRALPASFYGNVFVCEPAGNLIKRNVVEKEGLDVRAHDPKPGTEFLASTDERFRPVHLASGPDGALYVADMYRGLVEHGSYITPYLRDQTLKRKLDKPVDRGRIWRIVPENWTSPGLRRLSRATATELVSLLSHPDGWYRDMAQRLLVERGDSSVRHLLFDLVAKSTNRNGRFFGLWTLEGLHLLNEEFLFPLVKDPDPLLAAAAVRLLEPMVANNEKLGKRLAAELLQLPMDTSPELVLQSSLSAAVLDQSDAANILASIANRYDSSALLRDAIMSSLQDHEFAFIKKLWQLPSWQQDRPTKRILLEMLTSAVARRRNAGELAALLAMLPANDTLNWKEQAVLTGLAIQARNAGRKPVRLASPPAILTARGPNIQGSNLLALGQMFEWPGHTVDTGHAQVQIAFNDTERKQFVAGRQVFLATCAGCHGADGEGLPRFAPPLAGSEWVNGNERRLVLILLHGIEGPLQVKGKLYDAPEILPVMPAHSTLDDASISAILTYIRNEWNNAAPPVSSRTVSKTRHTSQGRVVPWTATALNNHMLEAQPADEK